MNIKNRANLFKTDHFVSNPDNVFCKEFIFFFFFFAESVRNIGTFFSSFDLISPPAKILEHLDL